MEPLDIKIEMLKAGITQAAIARQLAVSQTNVCRVIHGQMVSHRIRVAVANAIGKDVFEIWPDSGHGPGRRKTG